MTILPKIALAGEHIFRILGQYLWVLTQYLRVLSQYLQVLSRWIHLNIVYLILTGGKMKSGNTKSIFAKKKCRQICFGSCHLGTVFVWQKRQKVKVMKQKKCWLATIFKRRKKCVLGVYYYYCDEKWLLLQMILFCVFEYLI